MDRPRSFTYRGCRIEPIRCTPNGWRWRVRKQGRTLWSDVGTEIEIRQLLDDWTDERRALRHRSIEWSPWDGPELTDPGQLPLFR